MFRREFGEKMARNIKEYSQEVVELTSDTIADNRRPSRTAVDKSSRVRPRQNTSVCDGENKQFNNDDLICRICQKQYKNPKLLPCLHTFCRRCLDNCVENGKERLQIKCPLCSTVKEITTPDNALDECLERLVSDFVALNALDSLAVNGLDKNGLVVCGHCSARSPAVSRCSECAVFLCVNCQRTHKRTSATRNHNVCSFALLDVEPNETLRKVNYCRSHTGEELTYYCKTCDRPVCNDCTFLDHPKGEHALATLSDISSTQRRQLAELLSNVRRKLPFLRHTLLDMDSILRAMPDHADAVAREIARNTENFIRTLKHREEQLLDDLTKLCLHKVRVLREQRGRIQSEIDILEANCETTEKILRNGSDSDISSVNSLVCERMQLLGEMSADIEADENAEFGYDSDDAVMTEAILGSGKVYLISPGSSLKVMGDGLYDAAVGKVASFTLAKSKHCEVTPEDIDIRIETPDSVILACDVKQTGSFYNVFYNPKVPGEHEISVTIRGDHLPDSPTCVNVKKGHMTYTNTDIHCLTFGRRGNTPGYFDRVSCVAVRHNGDIVTADSYNHRIQVFNSKGTFVSQFGKKGEDLGRLLYPAGLAISPEGHVIVTEHGNNRAQVFTSDGVYLRSFGGHGDAEGLMDHPTGIAVDEEGQFVIVDQRNHRVQVFDANGCFKHHFGCHGDQNGQFDRPMYVAINEDAGIVVTDSGNHRVQIFDEDGRFQRAFGRQGTNDGEFYYPTGITIDACGYVYVSDKSNRIQVFTPELEFETTLDTKLDRGDGEEHCLMGLDYTPDGKIAVADKGNSNVKVLYT